MKYCRSILLAHLIFFCLMFSYGQTPLEKMIQENVVTELSLTIGNERVASNLYKSKIHEYVLFNFNTEIAQRVIQETPQSIELTVPTSHGDVTLQLVKTKITSPDFRIETSSETQRTDGIIGTHYQGVVKGESGSLAAVSFFDGSISILGSTKNLGNFTINKISPEGDTYISYYDADLATPNVFDCHTEDPEEIPFFIQNNGLLESIQQQRNGDVCIRVHFEADYDLYNAFSQSVSKTVEYVQAVFNQVKVLYTAEDIDVVISYIKVWDTPDSFQGEDSGETIDNFQNYFLTEANLNGDLGHLVAFDAGGNGGVARGIDVLCTREDLQLAYSDISTSFQNVPNYSFTVMVVTHEMGHNIGSPHTHGCYWNGNGTQIDDCASVGGNSEGAACYDAANPIIPVNGGTIMSYCHTNPVGINFTRGFGVQPGDLIRASVSSAACLASCAVDETCLPPYQLQIENVDFNTAEISWWHDTETLFEVEIKAPNSTSIQVVNNTSISLTGLSSGEKYEVSVRTLCANESASESVSVIFSTLCDEVYALPYIELFDGDKWQDESYDLDPCWTSILSTNRYGWTVGKFETSSVNTGPNGDHTSGFGNYVYSEASLGENNDQADLITPLISLLNTESPFATYWYHMFGTTVKDLAVYIREEGENWELLQTFFGPQQTSIDDEWLQDRLLLDNYAGKIIQLKFTSKKGSTFEGDIAIDDLVVSDSTLTDLAIKDIISPESGCGLSTEETISIQIVNNGYQTIFSGTNLTLDLSLDGLLVASESITLNGDLEPNEMLNFSFANSINLSNPSSYIVEVKLSVANDQVIGNNKRSKTVISKPVIDFYPYTQSFESYSDWTAGGIESSWALGTPAKSKIIGASDGNKAWVTGGLGLGQHNADEESYLEGPCFDFTYLENGTLSFDVWWEIETIWDGATFQFSTNQGQTWQVLGSAEDDNWFNSDTITTLPNMDGWTGTDDGDNSFDGSEGWLNVTHDISNLAGEPSVFFRILFKSDVAVHNDGIAVDDFNIEGDFNPPACYYTTIENVTCNLSEAGVTSVVLQDITGCDSVVRTITRLLPVYNLEFEEKVCAVEDVREEVEVLLSVDGCDSIITTNYVLAPSYDVEIVEFSCNDEELGTETFTYFSEYGCDRTVTINTVEGSPIEVTINQTSCNPSDLGTVVEMFTSVLTECDSIVTIETTFEELDADFSFTVANAEVVFSNTSNFGSDFSWNFGDGNTSSIQSPIHSYTESDVYSVELIVSEDGCESDTAIQEVDVVISGIDLISFIESVQIYPNPNNGEFTVEINGANIYKELEFTLFDVTGSEIDSRNVTFNSYAKENYAIKTLANGVYFLKIQSGNQISTYKINILR